MELDGGIADDSINNDQCSECKGRSLSTISHSQRPTAVCKTNEVNAK